MNIQSVKKFEGLNPQTGEMEWISYKITHTNGYITFVPLNSDNIYYQNILQWVEEGNTIEEAD